MRLHLVQFMFIFDPPRFSDESVLDIQVPYLAFDLEPNTIYYWNYTTTPQPGLDGRDVVYPRGRVLGGSTSISESGYAASFGDEITKMEAA